MVEDGGRLGGHAQAMLDELAIRAARIPRRGQWMHGRQVAKQDILTRWLQRLSSVVHGAAADLVFCSLASARVHHDGLDVHRG